MAEKDKPAEAAEGGDDAATAATAAAKKKKKLMMIGAGAAVLLLGGGGTAFMLSGGKAEAGEQADAPPPKKATKEEGHGGAEGKKEPFDVPPILVNLRSPDGAPHFLKVHVMLLPGEDGSTEELKDRLPVLVDAYQPFLRELRPEDLAGSAAVFRIKEELLVRATAALGEGKVKDVLVQDLIQQ